MPACSIPWLTYARFAYAESEHGAARQRAPYRFPQSIRFADSKVLVPSQPHHVDKLGDDILEVTGCGPEGAADDQEGQTKIRVPPWPPTFVLMLIPAAFTKMRTSRKEENSVMPWASQRRRSCIKPVSQQRAMESLVPEQATLEHRQLCGMTGEHE